MRYALEAYIRVYELEGVDINNARLMYLIGELYRRLDEPYEAVKWFARVVNDKRIMDAGMIKASREAWQNICRRYVGEEDGIAGRSRAAVASEREPIDTLMGGRAVGLVDLGRPVSYLFILRAARCRSAGNPDRRR